MLTLSDPSKDIFEQIEHIIDSTVPEIGEKYFDLIPKFYQHLSEDLASIYSPNNWWSDPQKKKLYRWLQSFLMSSDWYPYYQRCKLYYLRKKYPEWKSVQEPQPWEKNYVAPQQQHLNAQKMNTRSFSELLEEHYQAQANKDQDKEFEVKRDVFKEFGVRPDVFEKKTYELLTLKARGKKPNDFTKKRSNVRLRGQGLDWCLAGFLPKNDISLLWGKRGAGKTRLALEMAYELMTGGALLDRQIKCQPKKVLFLASDSGREPVEEELEKMGLLSTFDEHPNFDMWCFDLETNQDAWGANLRDRIELFEYVKANPDVVVVKDSAKAICTKADLNYADNKDVTEYMTFLKEVITPYATVLVLAHDGTRRDQAGGAGAWEEIPSMVMSCSRIKDGEQEIKNERLFKVHKSRKADERTFHYKIGEDGRLETCIGTEIINDAKGLIWKFMNERNDQGEPYAHVDLILQGVRQDKPEIQKGTITNNLSLMSTGKTPKLMKVKSKKGVYKINPYYLMSNR